MDATGTRKTFQRAYIVLAISYGVLCICAWVCFILTNVFMSGTGSGYNGALAAIGGMIPALIANCGSVARYVMIIPYSRMYGNCCSFASSAHFVASYPFLLILAGLVEIVVAAVYGIGYGDRVADVDQKNADANLAMGIINVVVGCFVVIVSVFAFHFGQMLSREVCLARQNQGAFAPGSEGMDEKTGVCSSK